MADSEETTGAHDGVLHLLGTGEIASLLGVHRSRIDQLSRQVGFPPPVASFSGKRAWMAADIVRWAEDNGRQVTTEPGFFA